MYDFLIQNAPSLLLLGVSDVAKIIAFVFSIFFLLFFLHKTYKRGSQMVLEKFQILSGSMAHMDEKEKSAHIVKSLKRVSKKWSMVFFFSGILIVSISLVIVEKMRSKEVTMTPETIYAGKIDNDSVQNTLSFTAKDERVLGENDETSFQDTSPSSQNYRLGQITIAGDTQVFIAQKDTVSPEITNIGYRVMMQEDTGTANMIVQWKTNKPAKGKVSYRKYSDVEFKTFEEENFNFEHATVLERLDMETTYVFFIESTDKWAVKTKSEMYAMYSGEKTASLFDLLGEAFGDIFGWAVKLD